MTDKLGKNKGERKNKSFKKARQMRRKSRIFRGRDKSLILKRHQPLALSGSMHAIGPTLETQAKLTPDPLVIFRRKNILSDQQIWAFQRIRKAVQIITDGVQMRVSRFNDVVVQTCQFGTSPEPDYEIRLQDQYHQWIELMTVSRLAAGPVLDIILEDMSLSKVDQKWGRRKGWAKQHLQRSLDLYGTSLSSIDRNG